jgi:predicted metal-binding membrane protein
MALNRARAGPASRAVQWPWLLVAVAWLATIAATLAGYGFIFNHDALIEGGILPWPAAALVFLLSWQLMTIAMMLPSSMPLVRLFQQANRANRGTWRESSGFLLGYAAIWTGFAVIAFLGDTQIHHLVDTWPWLAGRPWLIAGLTLMVAGGFQFTPLKERCLTQCRSPFAFFVHHYRRGFTGAWKLGVDHGRFCLGCCWALMLLMFGLGVGSLPWMVNLAVVMFVEKTTPGGRRLVPLVGAGLVLLGALVLWRPALLAILTGGLAL